VFCLQNHGVKSGANPRLGSAMRSEGTRCRGTCTPRPKSVEQEDTEKNRKVVFELDPKWSKTS
jgi:hypothetical protein